MDRQARIVRFWFLLAAVAVLGLWHPALWFFAVPLFFFPGCACCGVATCSCCDPTSTTTTLQVDLAGFTDNSCTTCETYNDSFVTTNTGPNECLVGFADGGCCWWYEIASGGCTTASTDLNRVMVGLVRTTDVDLYVLVHNVAVSPTVLSRWQELSISPDPDCNSFSGMSVPYNSGATGICSFDSSDAVVTSI